MMQLLDSHAYGDYLGEVIDKIDKINKVEFDERSHKMCKRLFDS